MSIERVFRSLKHSRELEEHCARGTAEDCPLGHTGGADLSGYGPRQSEGGGCGQDAPHDGDGGVVGLVRCVFSCWFLGLLSELPQLFQSRLAELRYLRLEMLQPTL